MRYRDRLYSFRRRLSQKVNVDVGEQQRLRKDRTKILHTILLGLGISFPL
jgi:hypothetical protein